MINIHTMATMLILCIIGHLCVAETPKFPDFKGYQTELLVIPENETFVVNMTAYYSDTGVQRLQMKNSIGQEGDLYYFLDLSLDFNLYIVADDGSSVKCMKMKETQMGDFSFDLLDDLHMLSPQYIETIEGLNRFDIAHVLDIWTDKNDLPVKLTSPEGGEIRFDNVKVGNPDPSVFKFDKEKCFNPFTRPSPQLRKVIVSFQKVSAWFAKINKLLP